MKRILLTILIILSIAILYVAFIFTSSNNSNNMKQNNEIKLTDELKNNDKLKLTSDVFLNNQIIPKEYSCDGKNINPPLNISNVPKGTNSLALIVHDPDAVSGDWVHWLVWNIPKDTLNIDINSVPTNSIQGLNGSQKNKYFGPCPPQGTHRYFFELYALDIVLELDKSNHRNDLENAMKGHILDQTELIGLYSR